MQTASSMKGGGEDTPSLHWQGTEPTALESGRVPSPSTSVQPDGTCWAIIHGSGPGRAEKCAVDSFSDRDPPDPIIPNLALHMSMRTTEEIL